MIVADRFTECRHDFESIVPVIDWPVAGDRRAAVGGQPPSGTDRSAQHRQVCTGAMAAIKLKAEERRRAAVIIDGARRVSSRHEEARRWLGRAEAPSLVSRTAPQRNGSAGMLQQPMTRRFADALPSSVDLARCRAAAANTTRGRSGSFPTHSFRSGHGRSEYLFFFGDHGNTQAPAARLHSRFTAYDRVAEDYGLPGSSMAEAADRGVRRSSVRATVDGRKSVETR